MYSKINKTKDGNFQHLCGSSIITSSFSITAAHCIQEKYSPYRRGSDDIFLIANVLDLKDLSSTINIDIQEVVTHSDWNPEVKKFDGDIALLKFKEPTIFDGNILPICLWNGSDEMQSIANGKIITFIALEEDDPGYYNYQHDLPNNYPKEYNMPIRNSCTETQKRFTSIATDNTFCAGGLNSGACLETGSSGSSMAVEYNQTYYLRGIVSASFIDFAGCDNYTYTLFTDVLKYQDWITNIIN
ncbi:serine protease gd-like [Chironomus tepperi]|uniref:serine protease gd-like n=1 Tax=Chironomus tepperi TaxID=113505 RepID=UPI00391EFC02